MSVKKIVEFMTAQREALRYCRWRVENLSETQKEFKVSHWIQYKNKQSLKVNIVNENYHVN